MKIGMKKVSPKTMKEQDHSIDEGIELRPGSSRDIKIELEKKMYLTIPVRSKDKEDVEEVAKKLVTYIRENLNTKFTA